MNRDIPDAWYDGFATPHSSTFFFAWLHNCLCQHWMLLTPPVCCVAFPVVFYPVPPCIHTSRYFTNQCDVPGEELVHDHPLPP